MNKLSKMIIAVLGAYIGSYFKIMLLPVMMLICSMAIDYMSGVAAAWFSGTLNSKIGKHGAIKKVCYMLLVVSAGIIDWLVAKGLFEIGIVYDAKYYFGMLVTIWLIINELLSILENCSIIGIPMPDFIKPIAKRLKIMVEKDTDGSGDKL